MDVIDWVNALQDAGERLAGTARTAGFDAEVPTCPGWRVRDLVRHTGDVHRWATMYVTTGHSEPVAVDEEWFDREAVPSEDSALLSWFTDGVGVLASALREAPAELTCWTFLAAPSAREHWARRQAHETTVHRIDAESAAGTATPVDPALAADGIDELLACFGVRSRRLRWETAHTLRVRADDTGDEWTVRLGPDRPVVTRTPPDGTVPVDHPTATTTELRGPAETLYRAL
ncbi:maleylpyruvate isomerase family mycothiol-dependent enzyme, partial [Saccharomonospora saliphila]|uniref:maleylpyruvate isomerase family mycothiol-dependent enzyme n=1 Tax=Saccharomonospora saliphila TaxID=369829 RepID=UPI0003669287